MTETTQPESTPEVPHGEERIMSAPPSESWRQAPSPNFSDTPGDRNPVELLADDFSARLRRGEEPSIEEYERRAPEHGPEIRSLFPTIELIERMSLQDDITSQSRRFQRIDRKTIGDFQLLREMGRGGMGVVYEAIQSSLGRRVALKVLGSGISNSPHQLHRFHREAESAARLHHTNIVPVYGIGEEGGIHFYAMQFIDGVSLSDVIATFRHRHTTSDRSAAEKSTEESSPRNFGDDSDSSHKLVSDPCTSVNDPTVLVKIDPEADSFARNFDKRPASSLPKPLTNQSGSKDWPSSPRSFENSEQPIPVAPPRATLKTVTECFGVFTNHTADEYFIRIARLVAQVAEALDHAHQHGVLHRDIKPANLMVDTAGSVWVMDFGLVKIVERQKDITLAGEIVGTLRYMAPEQLEGQADARTDVYALGLTLFELLTLRPAFDGDETATLAQRLRHSEIPRPQSLNTAIPTDLETIILKATAREPFARYESAALFAEDLRRFCSDLPILARRTGYLERLWRWSRRNPALAAATGSSIFLMWLVTVVASIGWFTVQSALDDAQNAQRRAEGNLSAAIDAFDGVMENVTSRGLPRAFTPGRVVEAALPFQSESADDDARLLNSLLRFYRGFALANDDNTRLRLRTAIAHRRAGTILVRLGRLSEAEEDFHTAITMLSTLLKSDDDNVEATAALASIQNEIGELYLRRGNFDRTFKAHLEARALLLDLPESSRSDPAVRLELARATDLFASIDIRSGTDEGPAPPLENSTRVATSAINPQNAENLATGHSRYDDPLSGRTPPHSPWNKLSEREKKAIPTVFQSDSPGIDRLAVTLLQASDEMRSLVREYPERPEYRYRLAQCLRHQLVHAASVGDTGAVKSAFHESLGILEQLCADFPEDPKYLFDLAKTLTQASRAEPNDKAYELLETAVADAEQLTENFPAATEYQLLLGTARARLAAAEDMTNTTTIRNAEVGLNQSIQTLEQLARQFPDQGIVQIPLAKSRQQLGDLLRKTIHLSDGPVVRLEEALVMLQQAIGDFETYLSKSGGHDQQHLGHFNYQIRTNLYESLAQTLTELERPEEAALLLAKSRLKPQPNR